MKQSDWQKLAEASADPVRVRHFLGLLTATSASTRLKRYSADEMGVLVALLSGSPALGNLLAANPDWLAVLDLPQLKYARRAEGIKREVESGLKPMLAAGDYVGALASVRRFKQREMVRIAARDLARIGEVVEITRELSDLADVCLDAVGRICRRQFTGRFGQPFHQDAEGSWQRTEFCVLGLGKLGGQELNYSSDVDVLFLYSDEGEVFKSPPVKNKTQRATMTNHQFFNKLAEAIIAEVSRMTPDGMLFRIDLRLRPEGETGPLCRSLESYENYYAQWGQTWERMMLIKARGVSGDEGLAAEFLETVQPFRYPGSISPDVLREVAAVKDRIEKEIVGAESVERNVKLGRGGIREIEFVAQLLQILHAGKQPFLQSAQTLPCLAKLAQYKLLAEDEARQLDSAYRFLRDVEHRLQMEENQQTHTIPADRPGQQRLARLMGFKSLPEFNAARQRHTGNVRRVYDQLLKAEVPQSSSAVMPPEFAGAEELWKARLASHSFRDPETAFGLLKEFAEGPDYVHVSSHTTELARQLILKILALCPNDSKNRNPESPILSDPDRVLTRLDSYIEAYGTRIALFEMWNGRPAAFELMLLLFDRSEFLAESAIRNPGLIDDFVAGGRLRQRKTAEGILKDLRHGLADEDQFVWLRRYHEAERMRLGLRDILGLVDYEQNLAELSALADACLQYALEVVIRKHKLKTPPFVVVGLGKLGGCEIDYGSDLDIVFVTDAKPKELPKLQRLAVEVMELLSRRTEQGMVFQTDARLRPDGEKGLLVNTLTAYEEYYRQRAQLWEIQALTRTRAVAGNLALGEAFQELAGTLTDFRPQNAAADFSRRTAVSQMKRKLKLATALKPGRCGLSTFTPDWKRRIHEMRLRIEKERTPAGQDDLAIKTGKGGLMDAEFIAQALCLANGWQEANTLRALERARAAGILPQAEKLLENYRKLRRVEGILRRWSYEGETVLPDNPAPYYRVSIRCGFPTPVAFGKALTKWRQSIRAAYVKVFPF